MLRAGGSPASPVSQARFSPVGQSLPGSAKKQVGTLLMLATGRKGKKTGVPWRTVIPQGSRLTCNDVRSQSIKFCAHSSG